MSTQNYKRPDDKNTGVSDALVDRSAIVSDNPNNEEIDHETAAVVVPPDSGWAWVVMIASFLCCTVVDGTVFCAGLQLKQLVAEFGKSEGYTAFVPSLLSGFYLMAGPFVSALANRFGFRPVTIGGALLAAAAFFISQYATSVEFLFISFGIIGGIGFCMIYIPAVVIIGFYFEKWRALATGIALCGSGVGSFLFTPLITYLLEKYTWRGTMMIESCLILLCVLFGLAFRPIQPITLSAIEEEDGKKTANGHGNSVAPKSQFQTNAFSKPLPEGRFAYSMPNSAHNTYMGQSPKHHYPTAAEVFRGANLERRPSNTSGGKGTELKVLRKSQPTTPNGDPTQLTFNLNKELSTVGENEEETENETLIANETKAVITTASGRRHTVSGRRPNDIGSKKSMVGSQETVQASSSRPMYRDDAFFAGSLTRIPQYQSQSSLAYHMSVTRLPTKQDMLEDRQKGCRLCPEAVRRTLSTMLDTSLLTSPSFMLLAFSGFLTMMGFFVPFSFLVSRAVDGGMNKDSASAVLSGIGLVNTIARVVCGSLSSFPQVKPLWLNNIAITAGGIATICSGIVISVATQWTFAVFFGICIACFSALRSLIAVEMIGLEKLTNAFGFLMLFQGIAATFGTPIAGALYESTGSYDVSFYFAGGLILLSAFLCYPLPWVAQWETARNEKKSLQPLARA